MSSFKSFDEETPPPVVLGKDYEGCEESATGGNTQRCLLEVDESLGGVPVIGVFDGRETIVDPTGIERCVSEGECCEGGGPNSQDDWSMMMRKPSKYADGREGELTGDEIVEPALCTERQLTNEGDPGQ